MSNEKILLSIIELGGYPDLTPLYKKYGYQPIVEYSMRKALVALKKINPAVVVAEFNYQSDFRDRTSSLESLIAVAQRNANIKLIVFYEKEYAHQFEKLKSRYTFYATFSYPIMEEAINETLSSLEK
jgi:TRAP-type mannitol/chloroaromatic compound transport system substrate-binding protein